MHGHTYIRNIVVFLTIYICTNNLFLLFDNTTRMTHFQILSTSLHSAMSVLHTLEAKMCNLFVSIFLPFIKIL